MSDANKVLMQIGASPSGLKIWKYDHLSGLDLSEPEPEEEPVWLRD